MKKYEITKICTANDLRQHAWLQDDSKHEDQLKKKQKS